MVATAVVMVLLPNGSPRYIYPLIVVPCLLLGRILTMDCGSGNPGWLPQIWSRVNLVLLAIVTIGILTIPFAAGADGWIFLWTCLAAILACCVWFFTLARSARRPRSILGVTELTGQAITSAAVVAMAMIVFALVIVPRIDAAKAQRSREVAAAFRAALPAGAQLWVLEDQYRPFWYYLEPNVRYFHRLADLPPNARYILVPMAQSQYFLQDPGPRTASWTLIKYAVDSENRRFDLLGRDAT
jgi:hypothetical protein